MRAKKEKFHLVRSWGPLFLQSFNEWMEDRALRFSAALAYYSIFAMAPLVVIAIAVAGLVFGEEAARGEVYQQIEWLLGPKGAGEIQTLIQASSDTSHFGARAAGGVGTTVGSANSEWRLMLWVNQTVD